MNPRTRVIAIASFCSLGLSSACASPTLAARSAPLIGCPEQEVATQNEHRKCTQGRYHFWEATCHGQTYYCSNLGDLAENPDTDATVGSHMHATVKEDRSQDLCSAMQSDVQCPVVAVDDHGGLDRTGSPSLFNGGGSQKPNFGGGH